MRKFDVADVHAMMSDYRLVNPFLEQVSGCAFIRDIRRRILRNLLYSVEKMKNDGWMFFVFSKAVNVAARSVAGLLEDGRSACTPPPDRTRTAPARPLWPATTNASLRKRSRNWRRCVDEVFPQLCGLLLSGFMACNLWVELLGTSFRHDRNSSYGICQILVHVSKCIVV